MTLYSTLVSLHVITAILGLGPVALLTFSMAGPVSRPLTVEQATGLLRWMSWGLAGMLLTGAAVIALTHGALGEARWLRVSFALFVVLGALQGLTRRQLRKTSAEPGAVAKALRPLCWAMCLLIAAITYLMEAKPW